MNSWLVIATRPRWEKKVHQMLSEKGIECYCPLNKVHRKWSDRIKMVEEPLFKSYVFVKIKDNDRPAVRMTSGVMNFVYSNGRPAILKENQIRLIRNFIDTYRNIDVVKYDSTISSEVHLQQAEREFGKKKIAQFKINGSLYILSADAEKNSLAKPISIS